MAFTQSQALALENAIASGVLIVEFSDGASRTKTQYQSISEMRNTLAQIRKELSLTSAPFVPPSAVRLYRSANNGL